LDRRRQAFLEATFAVVVWGASFVATKIALREVSPATVVWLRFSMGTVILWLAVFFRRQYAPLSFKELGYIALLGFLGITFHQWLQATGLLTVQATTTAWIVATTPVFMAILGWLMLREKLLAGQILGIGLATIGVLLLVSRGNLSTLWQGNFGTKGDFLILISAINWAVFSVLSRRGLKQYPATLMMAYVMGFGWLFNTIWLFAGPGLIEIPQLEPPGWIGIIFLGLFCSGLAYIFWYDALQVLSVAQTGAFLYIEPFITLIVAAVLINEVITPISLFGGVLILIGVWLVQNSRRR